MSAIEKEIRNLIFDKLNPVQRYQLALAILNEYIPKLDSEELSISDTAIEEYRHRRETFLKGDMTARPWRESFCP